MGFDPALESIEKVHQVFFFHENGKRGCLLSDQRPRKQISMEPGVYAHTFFSSKDYMHIKGRTD